MPIDASTARNTFLATMATVVQRGAVHTAESMQDVAEATATEIAKGATGIDASELLAALPDTWRSAPDGHAAREQMNAFLQVASPVLGVDQGVVNPLATRGVTQGQDLDAAIAINRARAAGDTPSAALGVQLDLVSGSPLTIRDALEAAFQDPTLIGALGGDGAKPLLRELANEVVTALSFARPVDDDAPVVLAGGVPVSGPDVHRAARDRRYGMFRAVDGQTSVAQIAVAAIHVAALRANLDETKVRSAIDGGQAGFICGQMPPRDAMPLQAFINDDGAVGIGIGIEPGKLRAFHDNPSLDDDELTSAVGKALRQEDEKLQAFISAGLPLSFFMDEKLQNTSVARDRLAAAGA